MAFELRHLIESEFDLFTDKHATKRGKRHMRDGVGLNLNRKHQGIIADVHKADPNQIGAVERLRKLGKGRGFVTFQEGEKLRQKYGLKEEIGYLGTTGIKIVKSLKGYDLIKEANVSMEGEKYAINSPDDIWAYLPGRHVVFSMKDNVIYYKVGVGDTHFELSKLIMKELPGIHYQTYPKVTKQQFLKLRTEMKEYALNFQHTADRNERDDWGPHGNPRQFFDITGRIGLDGGIVAFWNPLAKINGNARLLRSFFKTLGFTENPIIVATDNPNAKFGMQTVTQKIDQEILKRQHLSPELKKLSDANRGSSKLGNAATEAGFKSSAEYDQQRIVGDSVE